MVFIEGKGEKAPPPDTFSLTDHDLQVCLREAKKRAKHRKYKAKSGAWKQGLKGPLTIEGVGVIPADVRAIFAGNIGEYGLCLSIAKHLNIQPKVDFSLTRDGDKGKDVVVCGLRMQVKTCQKSDGENLVRITDEHGNGKRESVHAFVFCEWQNRTVRVRGWCEPSKLDAFPRKLGVKGNWLNVVAPPEKLEPIIELCKWIEARRRKPN